MNDEELSKQQPKDIDEALACMKRTLEVFLGRPERDKRAIFVHVYYEMTVEVYNAINGKGDYAGKTVFMDPEWVRRLSGKFATRYFRSLCVDGLEPNTVATAWKVANATAKDPRSTVVLNALLGINAHINYDLAGAIAENLDPMELKDPAALQMRKFDHDQVNNLLVRSLGRIQDILGSCYDPGIADGDRLLGGLDERLSEAGLGYYRERVWWDAIAYAAAMADDRAALRDADSSDRREDVVRAKLEWESHKIADYLLSRRWLWRLERVLGLRRAVLRKPRWDQIEVPGPEVARTTLRIPTSLHR